MWFLQIAMHSQSWIIAHPMVMLNKKIGFCFLHANEWLIGDAPLPPFLCSLFTCTDKTSDFDNMDNDQQLQYFPCLSLFWSDIINMFPKLSNAIQIILFLMNATAEFTPSKSVKFIRSDIRHEYLFLHYFQSWKKSWHR